MVDTGHHRAVRPAETLRIQRREVRDAAIDKRFYVFTNDDCTNNNCTNDAAARFDRIVGGENPQSPGPG